MSAEVAKFLRESRLRIASAAEWVQGYCAVIAAFVHAEEKEMESA